MSALDLDLSRGNFKNIMHLYITNSGIRERDCYQKGHTYQEQDIDTQILMLLLANKYSEKLLVE